MQILRFYFLIFVFFISVFCQAQDTLEYNSVPETNQPIAPLLKNMSYEDKVKTLDYLRYLGSNIDDEIQNAFDQIPTSDQQKALQFMYTQQTANGAFMNTTVNWNIDTLDLGIIEEGKTKVDSFVVTNTGINSYLVFRTATSCDCSVLRHPIYPVKPGEKNAMYIEFDSSKKDGPFLIGLVVYDNSRPNSRKILYIKGRVRRRS
jgi:Protein of unknown function (DUF1573)